MYIKTLTKEKRNEIKSKFLSSEESIIYKKANRVFILGLIGIIFSIGTTIFDCYYKTGTWYYVLDGLLFVFSAAFVYKTTDIKNKELNKFALKHKKNTKLIK